MRPLAEEGLRCFLAVPVGREPRDELARWQRRVRGRLPNARWVEPGNYHLTLKFYGNLEPRVIERLGKTLEGSLTGVEAFPVELAGFGAFPGLRRPRVLWAGVREGAERLRRLAGVVEAASVGMEIPADRRDFHPHLTLARFRVPARGPDIPDDVLSQRDRRWGWFVADQAKLIHSRLTPNGPRYAQLQVFRFSGAPAAAGERKAERTD